MIFSEEDPLWGNVYFHHGKQTISFPVSQKRFAIGEVIAHLKYLEEEGVIRQEAQKHRRIYSLDGNR